MCLSNRQLDEHIAKRDLIAISRSGLDSNKLQGFPLSYSPDLLLLRYVFDFHLDGLLLVHRRDITDYYCRETDRFQRKLLEAENRLKRGLFRSHYSVENVQGFLRSLDPNKIVIIENETPESSQFFIGRFVAADKQIVKMQEFSGVANWKQEATEIPAKNITCCQIDTNYINFYTRHFKRTSQ